MTKTCTKCGETKPLTEFRKNATGKDGLRGDCRACCNAYNARWRQDNPDYGAAWQRANPDKVNARAAKYRRANPDKVAVRQARWRQDNPDYWVEYSRANPHVAWETSYRQRCRKFGLTSVIESFTREDVVAQYGDGCFYCDTGAFEELDHHICVAAGGSHTLANARPSCTPCNTRKVHTTDRADIDAFRRTIEEACHARA